MHYIANIAYIKNNIAYMVYAKNLYNMAPILLYMKFKKSQTHKNL